MPFVFLALGLMLVVTGVRNTQTTLFNLVKSDFTGNGSLTGSYMAWLLAIMGIGALGYFKPIKPISDGFLILILVVLFLSNKGVFAQFTQQINSSSSASNPLTQANMAGVSALQNQNNLGLPNASELSTLQNFFNPS